MATFSVGVIVQFAGSKVPRSAAILHVSRSMANDLYKYYSILQFHILTPMVPKQSICLLDFIVIGKISNKPTYRHQ